MDDLRIEIHVKMRFRGKKTYKQWGLHWWPSVPRTGDLIHIGTFSGIDYWAEVEAVRWENDLRRSPDYRHACVGLYCKSHNDEPYREPQP